LARTLPIVFVVIWTVLVAGAAAGANALIARFAAPPTAAPSRVAGAAAPGTVAASSPAGSQAAGAPARPRALGQDQYLDGIMGRNLFDIAMIDLWATRRPAAGGSVVQSDLDVRLIATLVADPAEYSSALIADQSTPDLPATYSIGDVLHDHQIDSIGWYYVGLKGPDGTIRYLLLNSGDLVAASAGEPAPAEGEGTPAEGVTQLGENKYAISKDVFDKYLNDPEGLAGLGRALLHRGPDGEYDGYRLSAIRRNSIADQLGIKNGDIVHAVNGQPLNSVQAAMGAFGGLKSESKFCFEVSRRGSPTEICYEVQ
jgi:hypothetical protein